MALKCDLREQNKDEDEDGNTSHEPKRPMIDYKQGLAVAEKIKALRYLGEYHLHNARRGFGRGLTCLHPECSAMKNRGVNEAFTEAARVALQVKNVKGDKATDACCNIQ